jgi:hypothetical protein
MRRGGDLLEGMVGLRKGPQEYHSAPGEKWVVSGTMRCDAARRTEGMLT